MQEENNKVKHFPPSDNDSCILKGRQKEFILLPKGYMKIFILAIRGRRCVLEIHGRQPGCDAIMRGKTKK